MMKMVILDQSKPIYLIFEKKSKFVNITFIIHKNGNKTSIRPILNQILHLLCSIIFFVR